MEGIVVGIAGSSVGSVEGNVDGLIVGSSDGSKVGSDVIEGSRFKLIRREGFTVGTTLEGLQVGGKCVGRTLGDNEEVVVGFAVISKVGSDEGRRVDLKTGHLVDFVDGLAVKGRELGVGEGNSLGAEELGFSDGILLGFAGFEVGLSTGVLVGTAVVDGRALEGL